MNVATAQQLIAAAIYKPGWRIWAEDHSNRFEDCICLNFEYPARSANREEAPDYPTEIMAKARFPMMVGDVADAIELYRQVLLVIINIEAHEAREFLRLGPTMWAPFHPHRKDGMKRWGDVEGDLKFGIS